MMSHDTCFLGGLYPASAPNRTDRGAITEDHDLACVFYGAIAMMFQLGQKPVPTDKTFNIARLASDDRAMAGSFRREQVVQPTLRIIEVRNNRAGAVERSMFHISITQL